MDTNVLFYLIYLDNATARGSCRVNVRNWEIVWIHKQAGLSLAGIAAACRKGGEHRKGFRISRQRAGQICQRVEKYIRRFTAEGRI